MAILRHHILSQLRKTVVSLGVRVGPRPPQPPVRMFSKLHFDPSSAYMATRINWRSEAIDVLGNSCILWAFIAWLHWKTGCERRAALAEQEQQHLAEMMGVKREFLRLLQNTYGDHVEGIVDPEAKSMVRRLRQELGDGNTGSQ